MMNRFQLWAPNSRTVELVVGDRAIPFDRGELGWWNLNLPDAWPGLEYFVRLDGGPLRPDPRSQWQPYGVHGPSKLVDHASFLWTDLGFQARPLSAALFYELHVGTFTAGGTFDAAIEKLEHLAELGVTHVEIMPVADFPGEFGWGYDGVSLFAPSHVYGGPDGLKRLVDAAHQRGLAVILDVVYNHLGPRGNYLAEFGPYFSDKHHTPWGSAVNFDGPRSDQVRRYFCDNAIMWLRDYHMDGLRLDAVHAILDTAAIPFLEQLATEVDELKAHLGRHMVLIAESDLNDPRVVRCWQMGGFGLDAQWSDDFHHALHSVITNERNGYYSDFGSIQDLAVAFEQPYVYAGRHSKFRRRHHGRPPTGLLGHSFLSYVQNHDQLGNRAQGDRLAHLTNLARAKIAAALVMTSPYVPMLFQGEEWAASSPFQYFADFSEDPELARQVREGRRKEFSAFGWQPEQIPDPGSRETFFRSKLDWSELSQPWHAEMLAWHRQLIALRRAHSALTNGRLDTVSTQFSEEGQWLVVERLPLIIACNLSPRVQTVPICQDLQCDVLLASESMPQTHQESVDLPPDSIAILHVQPICGGNGDAQHYNSLSTAAIT